jgi:hypothetical protein
MTLSTAGDESDGPAGPCSVLVSSNDVSCCCGSDPPLGVKPEGNVINAVTNTAGGAGSAGCPAERLILLGSTTPTSSPPG